MSEGDVRRRRSRAQPHPDRIVQSQSSGTLTARETEILALVASGCSNEEIAHELALSRETVKSHTKHILMKLEARNRAHAVALGFLTGLLTTASLGRSLDRSRSPLYE